MTTAIPTEIPAAAIAEIDKLNLDLRYDLMYLRAMKKENIELENFLSKDRENNQENGAEIDISFPNIYFCKPYKNEVLFVAEKNGE
ncbi:hypothetical protein ACSSV9_14315 [Melioribacter sp. OK-6-Me]|uniref:hypothetical protein n=1 Tax=Melioribacter sp. OK-6-Me TaxID=3423433 RepID=UPI003EDA492A